MIFKDIKYDFKRTKLNKCRIFLIIYRLGNLIEKRNFNILFKKIIISFFRFLYLLFVFIPFGIEVPFEASIGKGLRLVHLNGIVINKNSIIGDNATIFHQVTIGANENGKDNDKAPKIGKNVYIGAGAKIIGDICIGNNVKIGANAVVTRSVGDNCTVVGNNIIKN